MATQTIVMTLAMASATGAGLVVLNFSRALRAAGWQVVVVCGPPSPTEGEGSTAGLRALGVEVRVIDRLVAPTWPVWRQLRRIAETVKPVAVIGIGQRDRSIAMALSRALEVPGIVTAQNQHVFWGVLPVRLAKRALYSYSLRNWASLVVCTSEPVRNEIHQLGVPHSRTVLLPNGVIPGSRVVLSTSERAAIRAELGAGTDDVLLLNVGRLDLQKGQDILIDAFVRCAGPRPRLRLALIGDVSSGPTRQRMEVFANEVKQRANISPVREQIKFAGWRKDVPRLLAASDGYIHSARWEGFSFAILEAMAAYLPVVITDCSGRPEGFEDGKQGWMVPKGDADSLAVAMGRLADLPLEARESMGQASRKVVEMHYDIERIGARFAELVGEAIARGR